MLACHPANLLYHMRQRTFAYQKAFIAVVKKTFRYLNVFFYNHLYQPSVFWNLF